MALPMENIVVDLLPKGERPVLHVAQYDNARTFFITLQNNGVDYAVPESVTVELRVRKVDGHVVTIAPNSITSNILEFTTTEQMCACFGHNIGEIAIIFLDGPMCSILIDIEVQRDVLQGGVDSASDIHNLETQIEDIIDDDLPGKLNELVPPIVDSELGNYYTKSEVDTALSAKADSDALATVATTGDYDDLINKPSLATVATSGSYNDLLNKPYIPNTYSTTEEQIVGTWIDGRPIYRKVVAYENNLPSASGWQTLVSVPGVEAVINSRTIVDENTSGRTIGTRDMYLIEAAPTYNNIQIYNASPYGVYVKWVILEYIKTA